MVRIARLLPFLLSTFAQAGSFTVLPAETGGGGGLEARVLRYHGGTNGTMAIEVRNPTGAPVELALSGVYFVPVGDPDSAPQRLGAIGPFLSSKVRHERLTIAPGAKIQADVDVYCIDSHRPSPTSATPFSIAQDRLAVELRQAIDAEAKEVSRATGGIHHPASKGAVQGTVWKHRDKKWLRLRGEGVQEKNK